MQFLQCAMCVLTIKRDEHLNPLRAKSCIVVLGNHEDRSWSKSDKYAPVLCSNTMRLIISMAVERCHVLKQGDFRMLSVRARFRLMELPHQTAQW